MLMKDLSHPGHTVLYRRQLSWLQVHALCVVYCCVLCFDFHFLLCPLSLWSSLCLLPFLIAWLSPPVCQHCCLDAFSSVPSPHHLTCLLPSTLFSPAPRPLISNLYLSLCSPFTPCLSILSVSASVSVMSIQSPFCLQSPHGMCFWIVSSVFFHVWVELWFFFYLYFAFFFATLSCCCVVALVFDPGFISGSCSFVFVAFIFVY